ncbi:hypothetical protein [Ornithinimicrobium sp. CNJ-824]|uniref:hypothetical protein n=1 Tax=Ornithinimicrobium sp. CNJ-824 TaxID=1904966 RepID=UPI00117C0601|nr:hypothetical protein [Ornithinimicrobium sp. CNJ-824]
MLSRHERRAARALEMLQSIPKEPAAHRVAWWDDVAYPALLAARVEAARKQCLQVWTTGWLLLLGGGTSVIASVLLGDLAQLRDEAWTEYRSMRDDGTITHEQFMEYGTQWSAWIDAEYAAVRIALYIGIVLLIGGLIYGRNLIRLRQNVRKLRQAEPGSAERVS